MAEDHRLWWVKELLFDYVRSPSLKHIRDPYSVIKLAQEILRRIDRGNSIWTKWDGQRELLLRSALCCWIPVPDLHAFLNQMPGPPLTLTDVAERQRALEEEEPYSFPREELQAGCLELYQREKEAGTELPAIIGALRTHIEQEEERLRLEHDERYRLLRLEDKRKRELRLQSGADSGWLQLDGSACWFCRTNGRTYRLTPGKDQKLQLHRVQELSEEERGVQMGVYQKRGDASKVVAKAAYQPDLI
jgi:hypothetical protein